MNTYSQRLTYEQVKDKFIQEYNSIPFPKLRVMAKESGFIQGSEESEHATLCESLANHTLSKEFRKITHTIQLPTFQTDGDKHKLASKEVLDYIYDKFLYRSSRVKKNQSRISVTYDIFPAKIDMEARKIYPPPYPQYDTPTESTKESPQFSGTIYRSRWYVDGARFYEETMTIDKPGEYTFKPPWNN